MQKQLALSRPPEEGLSTDLRPLIEDAKAFAEHSSAKRTRQGYAADWRAFESWCARESLPALPAPQNVLALYLTFLAKDGKKLSTIRRALSGIAFKHRESGLEWEVGHELRKVFKGIANVLSSAANGRRPLLPDDLRAILSPFGDSLHDKRDRAILTLGWGGAFRRSELAGLNVEDLQFEPKGLKIHLRRSKTDQEGEGRFVGVCYAKDPTLCATLSVRAWLDAANISEGPVFRGIPARGSVPFETRLDGGAVFRIVRRRIEAVKGKAFAELFGAHSLRHGFVTTAAAEKKSLDSIMRTTGHKSVNYLIRHYIKPATTFEDNASEGLL